MTQEEFLRIYYFMKSRYGIDMIRKKDIVQGRLENYIRSGGWKSYTEYMNAVESDITGNLEKQLVNILTTNHTFFMREFEHFDYMKSTVLPWLRKKEAERKDLAIWCGAASTGEEPYMLAMLLRDYFSLDYNEWDTKVLATDISTEALRQAAAGVYSEEQIQKLPEQWRRRYLRTAGQEGKYQIVDEIRREVLFRSFNLMEPFPFKRKMHVIFLRNVMIYFDHNTKRELIQKVYDVMEPGGYLFIGRTETIERGSVPLEMVSPSIFRKEEGRSRYATDKSFSS